MRDAPAMLTPAALAYARRLRRFGPTPRGVFWRDDEWQRRRYHILARAFRPEDRAGGISIGDFGCGYGAFFDYLRDRPVMANSRFTGYDMAAEMITACAERIDDPRARFVRHLRVIEPADYIFVSGTFNLKLDADDAAWRRYVLASLKQLWSMTGKVLAFNMLDANGDEAPQEGLYYASAEDFSDFCRRELSPNVDLSIDKPLPDWTMFVSR